MSEEFKESGIEPPMMTSAKVTSEEWMRWANTRIRELSAIRASQSMLLEQNKVDMAEMVAALSAFLHPFAAGQSHADMVDRGHALITKFSSKGDG